MITTCHGTTTTRTMIRMTLPQKVKLPPLYQSPLSEGCCIPRSDSPIQRWAGFDSEEKLTKFLQNVVPSRNKKECEDYERIVTAPSLQTELSHGDDPLEDMDQYIHTILDNDDPDIIECKDEYNEALIYNKEVQLLHENMEGKNNPIDKPMDTKINVDKSEK